MLCSACNKNVKNGELLKCSACSSTYHYLCANVTSAQYREGHDLKLNWRCTPCSNVTCRRNSTDEAAKRKQGRCTNNSTPNPTVSAIDPEILSEIKKQIEASVKETIGEAVKACFAIEFQKIHADLAMLKELKTAVEFMSTEYDTMRIELKNATALVNTLSKETDILKDSVRDLTSRLNLSEQFARECNIEVNGVPENNSENLLSVLKQLASVISVPVDDSDILSFTRVRKLDPSSSRPRSVIYKLSSTRVRDSILAATATYNKANKDDKLSSKDLGYAGANSPIYVSEHLSPYYKSLHAETRKFARDNGYKFVWIRDGKIKIRKDANSPAKRIKDLSSLRALLD